MQVVHEEDHDRFVVHLDDEEAALTYLRAGPKVMEIQHTYVPEGERGHGVAEALATAAFQFARERGYRVVPTCPFVRRWLGTHPHEAELVDARYAKSLENQLRA